MVLVPVVNVLDLNVWKWTNILHTLRNADLGHIIQMLTSSLYQIHLTHNQYFTMIYFTVHQERKNRLGHCQRHLFSSQYC